eukprot:CAMPEP_0206491230 /NCGR_PEP_ID=MMETSP0324_2-20121206/44794_1 /ASSEMBLY_ACC=CAM_ASM_000836 /TAXON_ID=2866 /ORGANISM="Crypthecodinium cohnii, Strain Seligo" /LENGTH=596 /DNA_ID=CAMNT_0053972225 /DNA_START=42 /DNA_END=1832 /DNA_ORIENTATION=+
MAASPEGGDAEPIWKIQHACGPTWTSATTCSFRVWAPHGEDVTVELTNSNGEGELREVKLTKENQFWQGEADNVLPGMRYRIALGSSWNDCFNTEGARLYRRDPCAREADFNSTWCFLHEPVVAPEPWSAPAFNKLLIYELHVGTFAPEDREATSFAFTTEKLEYLASLGYNCVQLMPTAEFGGIWGYNSRQLLASHSPWGSRADLINLVKKAHSLGISVLFDVVLNHGSSKMNTLWNWDGFGPDKCGGIYFEGEKDTPWGKRFAFHKAEVQDYLKQACRVCIEEYGVDGIRFDSVHNMPWWLLQMLTREIKEHYPDKILIAEITPETPKVISDAGFHSCWVHATHFDSIKMMKKFDGGGDPGQRLGMMKNMASPHGFPTIGGVHSVLGSHDQIGDRHNGNQDGHGTHRYYVSRLGGRGNWHGRAQCRAWFAFQNCARGLPMIFMGTENLQEDWWHVTPHHRFNWGLAEGDDAYAAEMRALVTASNTVRVNVEAMTQDEIKFVHEDAGSCVLGFLRGAGSGVCLCIAHFGEQQWENGEYGLHTGCGEGKTWKLILNSQAKEFGGWEGSAKESLQADGGGKIFCSIPKWSCLIYQMQ